MVEEITIQELAQMEPSACQIIDMRDETALRWDTLTVQC